MNEHVDTSDGNYFASVEEDVGEQYAGFHNYVIDRLERCCIVVADHKQDVIGSGNLMRFSFGGADLYLVITAEHNVKIARDIGSTIKIPINYHLTKTEWPEVGNCAYVELTDTNSFEDKKNDFAAISGFRSIEKENYEFLSVQEPQSGDFRIGAKSLVLGTLNNRVSHAERKNRETDTGGIVVNGFQLPTTIVDIKSTTFEVRYPTTMYFGNGIDPSKVREGRYPSPAGLSGSVVWSYEPEPKPLGIVIEQGAQTIRCLRFDHLYKVLKQHIEESNIYH